MSLFVDLMEDYDEFILISNFIIFVALALVSKLKNRQKIFLVGVPLVVVDLIYVLTTGGNINNVALVVCLLIFLDMCLDDLLTGEIYLIKILSFLFVTNILLLIYNYTIGCPCIGSKVAFSLIAFVLVVLMNEFLNRETSFGGADIYILSALVIWNICVFLAFVETGAVSFVMVSYFELLTWSIFVNFFSYFVVYMILHFVLKKKRAVHIRALPLFVLPMIVTLAMLFSVV